jgi:hypothetical protein
LLGGCAAGGGGGRLCASNLWLQPAAQSPCALLSLVWLQLKSAVLFCYCYGVPWPLPVCRRISWIAWWLHNTLPPLGVDIAGGCSRGCVCWLGGCTAGSPLSPSLMRIGDPAGQ